MGESLYIEAVPLALRPFLRLTPEVPLTTMSGHHMGSVDNWLCQNIHQIFGGSPAGYPRLRVESVLGFLLLRRVCSGLVSGGNASQAFHRGPRLGELSGGNLNGRSQQHVLYCAFAVGDWGLLFWRSPFLGTIPAASAVCQQHCLLSAVGVRLLPG